MEAWHPSIISSPAPRPTPRELRGDIVFAAVIFVGAILSATLSAIAGIYGDEQGSLQLALVYAFVLAAPLAVRRRWPATVAVIIAVAYFAAVTLRIPEVYVGQHRDVHRPVHGRRLVDRPTPCC